MKARRGDLAAVVRTRRDFYTDRPAETREEVVLMEVTSVTREGVVKAGRDAWGEVEPVDRYGPAAVYVLPAAEVDVKAVMRMAAGHCWPNSDTPRPFGSLADAKDAIRPFARAVAS